MCCLSHPAYGIWLWQLKMTKTVIFGSLSLSNTHTTSSNLPGNSIGSIINKHPESVHFSPPPSRPPGPSPHHLFPGSLQQSSDWSPCFRSGPLHSSWNDLVKMKFRSCHITIQKLPCLPAFPASFWVKAKALGWPTRPCVIWLLIPLWSHIPLSPSLTLFQPHWPSHWALNRPGLLLTQGPRHLCDSFSRFLQVFPLLPPPSKAFLTTIFKSSNTSHPLTCFIFFSLAPNTHTTHSIFHLFIFPWLSLLH